MSWLLALLWVAQVNPGAPATDPRIEWVELQRAGRFEEALERVETHLAQPNDRVSGAHYLRGRLLAMLGRHESAAAGLARALSEEPDFEPWIRFRLAEAHVAQNHPEVAAGLLATLLGANPSSDLRVHAADLLAATLNQGGDCRLLSRLDAWNLRDSEHRPLQLARSECTRTTDPAAADRELIALLAEDSSDGSALAAAERLATVEPQPTAAVALDMAMAFFGQRDFERALGFFARALAPDVAPLAVRQDYETQYAVARSYFWLGRYAEAGERYAALAKSAKTAELKARAHYQQARCLELSGQRGPAELAYKRAFDAEPIGSWSGSALSARLRLLRLIGQDAASLALYDHLGTQRRWQASRARAALFLAASDLVQDRTDRAPAWLATADATRQTHVPEVAYWKGRLAEATSDPTGAVAAYQRALTADRWDPWSTEARKRLAADGLQEAREQALRTLAASGRDKDLLASWLLELDETRALEARSRLAQKLAGRATDRAFLELAAVPTAAWPLWEAAVTSVEERLLALGDWQLGLSAAPRHFPFAEERLGLTRARALAEANLPRASILAAEILGKRSPTAVPQALWPSELAHTLYPLAHGSLIRQHTRGADFDPLLLAAVIREESRFDANATSAAAARGLTQFVLPTARRLSVDLGLVGITASDLYRPEIAIRLGATYLSELSVAFDGTEHQMLAAYNAGEAQAELWSGYCLSEEPAEYLTKVGFRETRGYLRKVLRSRARYRELYPSFGESTVAARPGISSSTVSK